MKDERCVKDKGLEADRKEKHLGEKFKPEDSRYLVTSWNWWWQEGQSFVEDACGHRYGAKYTSERDKGLIGEESV